MARKKQYQTRLDPDNAEDVDRYADDRDVTKAEALRRLIRTGLEAETTDETAEEQAETEDEPPETTIAHNAVGRFLTPALLLVCGILLGVIIGGLML